MRYQCTRCNYVTNVNSNIHKHVQTHQCRGVPFLRISAEDKPQHQQHQQQNPNTVVERYHAPKKKPPEDPTYKDPLENDERTDDAVIDALCRDAVFVRTVRCWGRDPRTSDLTLLLPMMAAKVLGSHPPKIVWAMFADKTNVTYVCDHQQWDAMTLDKYARAHTKYYYEILQAMCSYSIPRRLPDLASGAQNLVQSLAPFDKEMAFELFVDQPNQFQTKVPYSLRKVVTAIHKELKNFYKVSLPKL